MTIASLLQVIAQEANRIKIPAQSVFSATPYTGTNTNQSINLGLDLTGGLVWASPRYGVYDQFFASSATDLSPNTNEANFYSGYYGPRVSSTGFTLAAGAPHNEASTSHMSWSFKKRARFFTIVPYTGNGVSGRALAHDLGGSPGLVLIKRLDTASNWAAWHRGAPSGHYLQLNSTNASAADTTRFSAAPSASQLNLGSGADVNTNGGTYIAYIWAHEPQVQQIGSVAVSGGVASVDLGWEPQFLNLKPNLAATNWNVMDTARGWGTGSPKTIRMNGGGTEYSTDSGAAKSSTGFALSGLADGSYLYWAIRKSM